MTTSSRRMRRSRDATTPNDEILSGFDLYNIQGDSTAALVVFRGKHHNSTNNASITLASQYNCALLSRLSIKGNSENQSCEFMMKEMDDLELEFQARGPEQTPRKRRRNELIFAYNRALIMQTHGKLRLAAQSCFEKVKDAVEGKFKPVDELALVSSRLAFLLLECMLAVSVGHSLGEASEHLGINLSPSQLIEWLELIDSEKDPQHKFLLNLYRSRVDLAALDASGKHNDNKIRSARKELKQAMDIFQNKLRPSFGAESGSVVSSTNSEEISSFTPHHEHQQQPPSSVVLQKHNQSALSLKANSEQLKGNTKKSLILCSEAQVAAVFDSSYEAIHANNLAVVYETNGKRHLALHALTKSLRARRDTLYFHADGTSRPDQTIQILYNLAICALQARSYLSAYECMATCVAQSETFRNRPRCWLRMSEACIGLFADLKQNHKTFKFSTIEVHGHPKGIIVDNAMFTDHPEILYEDPVATLASPKDLEQVKRNPLVRAKVTLLYAMKHESLLEQDSLKSTCLALAYVHLAFKEYDNALQMAEKVLTFPESTKSSDNITALLNKRVMATARMFAAEASCALGNTMDAMKFLTGDGHDDAFDRLASDLGGVTLETASTLGHGMGKRRLARAQAMVRSSASTVTAALGNLTAAKQLAMSAQAMEDACASNRERSSARRALIYSLLRDGHHGPALSLLRSLR